MAFIRLIGTLYFKKNLTAFVALKALHTPVQVYNSITGLTEEDRHQKWYNEIRGIVSDRICTEVERVPSSVRGCRHFSEWVRRLWRHWLWSCWIAQMWNNAPLSNVYHQLPPPEEYGWTRSTDGSYAVDWDCATIQAEIQDTINFLIKGCSCKKGCKTKQCSCRKNNRECGPGCHSQGCTNLKVTNSHVGVASHTQVPVQEQCNADSDPDSDSDSCSTSSYEQEEVWDTEIITDLDFHLDSPVDLV